MEDGIRSVVVHLDGPSRAAERLQVAQRIATDHGASVLVLHAPAAPLMFVPAGAGGGGYVVQAMLEMQEQGRVAALAAFRDVLGTGGLQAEFIDPPLEDLVQGVAVQGMYSDLLVLGQHEPSQAGTGTAPQDFPERVLVRSGRPGILVPYAGDIRPGFGTVLIAWKETPEAARAVAAALPILRKATQVHVAVWRQAATRADRPGLDLRAYLQAHGIAVQWHEGGPEPERTGELLLSRAADLGADLLVMGCYGHGRAREWITGGVSRTVLRSMTLPVLMSH